ncbi:MAG: Metal-dependent phosphohydrolase, subdomain [Proteobacteria bacterium]|nr:Metal-dependent phosphohydrolase, subdomain [Pseudomonadota bacterium]
MEIVAVAQLKIGMFVAEPDCAWTELPFALQGFVISRPEQIDVFQKKCRFVYVDRSRSLNEYFLAPKQGFDRALRPPACAAPGLDLELPLSRRAPAFEMHEATDQRKIRRRRFLEFLHKQNDSEHSRALARELVYMEPRFDELQTALQRSFQAITAEKEIDLNSVREGVRDMSGSLRRNPDALLWLLRLKRLDQYSFDHAMDVSVYLLMLGTHIGWRGMRLVELGMAGMLQDVGKTQLPVDILAKSEPLTVEEQELIKSHVASSLEILIAQAHLPSEVLVIVSRHHERWDGSGYPRGLEFNQLGLAAEMAGLVDSFCAMLKNKPYRSALGHQEALEELYQQRDQQFSPALMEQFVQCVGLYPIGTLLELSSGEVGVVIQQNRVQRSRPRVLVMLDADKQEVRGYHVIDLHDEVHRHRRVTRALPHDAYGLASHDYYLG